MVFEVEYCSNRRGEVGPSVGVVRKAMIGMLMIGTFLLA